MKKYNLKTILIFFMAICIEKEKSHHRLYQNQPKKRSNLKPPSIACSRDNTPLISPHPSPPPTLSSKNQNLNHPKNKN